MLSDPRGCYIDDGMCLTHTTRHMLQIFSLKLSKVLVNGPVELYGYIAVRDNLDSLLNYVFNSSRDDPVIIEQVHLSAIVIKFHYSFCVRPTYSHEKDKCD